MSNRLFQEASISSNLRFKEQKYVYYQKLDDGALATETRCSVPTIRYYEEIGLLPKPERLPGGHRVYGEADRQRLLFISRCRDFGFSIEHVRELVALVDSPMRDCTAARSCPRPSQQRAPEIERATSA